MEIDAKDIKTITSKATRPWMIQTIMICILIYLSLDFSRHH